MSKEEANYHTDEPTETDTLDRLKYAKSFAHLCQTADTPLTVGMYASWGAGKTSLMKLVQNELDSESFHVIWFNLWEHQHVEHPVIALTHQINQSVSKRHRGQLKKTLTVVTAVLAGRLLRMTVGLKLLELIKLGNIYEEERFQTVDKSIQLRDHLKQLVNKVLKITGKRKIVFFIDDLDRCDSAQGLTLLNALKLYFNLERCVFFIGVDRDALQSAVTAHGITSENADYLDKIIQLPFTIPGTDPGQLDDFIKSLLPADLTNCRRLLKMGLGDNPRRVKRFINSLVLNHHLAIESISQYDATILATLLLIQYRNPKLYHRISQQPNLIHELKNENQGGELRVQHLEDDLELEQVIEEASLAEDPEALSPYFFLADAAGVGRERGEEKTGELRQEVDARQQTPDFQFLDKNGLAQVLNETESLGSDETVVGSLLIFQTTTQHTWLVATNRRLFALLDDANTREKKRVVQWGQNIQDDLRVSAYKSLRKGRNVVDIGKRTGWLYSRRLFKEHSDLERAITELIESARRMQ